MVQTIAGYQGTVTEVQEAQRFGLATCRAFVDTPASFKPTPQGVRTIAVAAGSMLCSGVLFIESSAQAVQATGQHCRRGTTRYRRDFRFTWNGLSSMVELFSKQGTAGSTTRPALTRNPGAVYEFPLAVVRVRQNVSTIAAADILDVRVGRPGNGAFQALQTDNIQVVDLPLNSQLQVRSSTYSATANDGAGNTTFPARHRWRQRRGRPTTPCCRPHLRRWACNLGAGGARRGFYQVKDGTCFVKFEIRKGTGAVNFGRGPLLVALPSGIRPSAVFTDQWATACSTRTSATGSITGRSRR